MSQTSSPPPERVFDAEGLAEEAMPVGDASDSTSQHVEIADDDVTDGTNDSDSPPVRVYSAERIVDEIRVIDERTLPVRFVAGTCSAANWCFGFVSMVFGLALLAPLPIAQFVSLGYLLESSARVARSGRLRDGFIGIREAARVGSFVIGAWLMVLPLRVLSDFWYNAHLISPGSNVDRGWRFALVALTVVIVTHIVSAWYCGGRLRHFFWPLLAPFSLALWMFRSAFKSIASKPTPESGRRPFGQRLVADIARVPQLADWFLPAILWRDLRRGRIYSRCRDSVWEFVRGMRISHFFWLGTRGFCGAVAWLFIPAILLMAAVYLEPPIGVLSGLLGAFLLSIVLLYLPFLQTRLASEDRFVAIFEIGAVRRQFRKAPLAFWIALLVTLLFALPLYLLTIETTPREVAFLPGIVFVTFIFPARLLTGWAIGRAGKRDNPRHFVVRWLCRFGAVPVVLYYVFIVFLMQYLHWHGELSLFEQHAFLVPAPFLGL